MRVAFRTVWFAFSVAVLSLSLATFVAAAPQQNHPDAAKMKNPVASSAASIAAGKKLYDSQCASCHGTAGKGDGKAGALLKPTPSDLTDADWKNGQTDGEIFAVIRDGSRQTGMRAYGSRIPANDIWNLVNYVRTLGPKTTKSH
jgi:mono/diheme cytochrome c family protein